MSNKQDDNRSDSMRIRPWALIGLGASIFAIMFMWVPIVAGIIALAGLGFSVFGVITGVTGKYPLRGVAIAGIVVSVLVMALAAFLIIDNSSNPKTEITSEEDRRDGEDSDEDYAEASEEDNDAEDRGTEDYYAEDYDTEDRTAEEYDTEDYYAEDYDTEDTDD